jgi:hypothetical protein
MGAPEEYLRKFAKKLKKTVNDLTTDEIAAADEMYQSALSEASESKKTNENNKSYTTENLELPDIKIEGGTGVLGIGSDLAAFQKNMEESFTDKFQQDFNFLTQKAQELGNSMGVGRARAGEFRATIADTIPEMVKLGIDVDQGFKAIEAIPTSLKTNATVANETIIELAATSQFTDESVSDLVKSFSEVGTQLSSVGDQMADVANYAKSVGVNVKEVTSGVVKNLGQLNLFNFDGGVQGLAKMTAQSAMLGVNMGKVFDKADSLLNPESAIEFSSALQRLGVTSSELLDPLSAMDMALNDPAKLQDQMTKVAQQFTRLKADGTGFEILPGAKLQLREVAKELGMNAEELASMAIKSSDLDMKLKQIRFPSFAASEDDRMLIANMSQMKDGKAVVQITDEKGTKKEVAVEDLTADELEKLKQDQANQAKSAEDLARDQLTVQTEIKNAIIGGGLGVRMGVASQAPLQRVADANLQLRGAMARNLYGKPTAEGTREAIGGVTQPAEEALGTLISGKFSKESVYDAGLSLTKIQGNLTDSFSNFFINVLEGAQGAWTDAAVGVSKTYKGVGGIQELKPEDVRNNTITDLIQKQKNDIESRNQIKQDLNQKVSVDFTNSDGSLKNLSPDQQKILFDQFLYWVKQNPNNLVALSKDMQDVVTGP